MAINATSYWRVRIGGNDLNGGGFDPKIVGAGTDYTDQDAPQLNLTDLATAAASANVSSATGGFTAAMIGNALRINSGTNFTAGTYFVVAVTDSNNAVLDRTCSTAAASGGAARLGGAHASIGRPSLAGAVGGNVVYVRGQGSLDPIDIDYANVGISSGNSSLTFVGYNGRPKISHNGRCFYLLSNVTVKNFFFVQISSAFSEGVVATTTGSGLGWLIDCVVDTAGFSTSGLTNYNALRCSFINTGTQAASSNTAVANGASSAGGAVVDCLVKDQRGAGIAIHLGRGGCTGNIVQSCQGSGIFSFATVAASFGHPISGNTVYNCGSHGISLNAAASLCFGNLIVGINGAGAFGLHLNYANDEAARNETRVGGQVFWDCATPCNFGLGALDQVLDPMFVNAPSDLTPTNPALRYVGGVGARF
jgi:hypothetical protein